MQCEDIAEDLAAAAEGDTLLGRSQRRHVERCLRCQAEVVQYRRVLRAMRSLRTEVLKAVVILALGIAMLAAPGVGDDGGEDRKPILAMLAWAWSRPLGLVFTAVGIVGLYALLVAARRRPAPTS